MGDFTLGCLLGQYDRAQSFDTSSAAGVSNIGSWAWQNCGISFNRAFQSTDVHSSPQGLLFTVNCGNTANLLIYSYFEANDVLSRWYPDITTHDIQADIRARTDAVSGKVIFSLDALGAPAEWPIPQASTLQHKRLSTVVYSESSNRPTALFQHPTHHESGSSYYVDDLLVQVDPITLHPEYEFSEQGGLIRAQHRTLGGVLHTYLWDRYKAWTMPLRYLPDSHARLINWWWEHQLNLAFTLDSSDKETTHVVRIVNERQPIGSKIRPYGYAEGGWQGVLQLESIDRGSLVF